MYICNWFTKTVTILSVFDCALARVLSSTTYDHSQSIASESAGQLSRRNIPNPITQQLSQVERLAHGTIPNGYTIKNISQEGITNLKLIAFNELFEIAFFSNLILNITSNSPGYEIEHADQKTFVLEALTTILAQEELHYTFAQTALTNLSINPVLPCQYSFPTTDLNSAIALTTTFTDLVLGTLQDVTEIFAKHGDIAFTRSIASVIGQEGEQNGLYRLLQKKSRTPSNVPFPTTSTRDFAFNALQAFVIPGSCPNPYDIDFRVFGRLSLGCQEVKPEDQNLRFSFDLGTLDQSSLKSFSGNTSISQSNSPPYPKHNSSNPGQDSESANAVLDYSSLSLIYINQQNYPVVEKLQNVQLDGSIVTFNAFFPFVDKILYGLTIVVVAEGEGPFDCAQMVANATLFGPALIEL